MPNISGLDFIPPHKHSPDDFAGAASLVLPPVAQAVGVTSGPTTGSATFADLAEMSISTTPPSTYPLWQAKVNFNGLFSHSEIDGDVEIQIVRGTSTVIGTAQNSTPVANGPMTIDASAVVTGLVAGTLVSFKVQWRAPNAPTATAEGVQRVFSVELTPYVPAAA